MKKTALLLLAVLFISALSPVSSVRAATSQPFQKRTRTFHHQPFQKRARTVHRQSVLRAASHSPLTRNGRSTSKNVNPKLRTSSAGMWGTAAWTFDQTTGTLTVNSGVLNNKSGPGGVPYNGVIAPAQLNHIIFSGDVIAPTDSSKLFSGLPKLKTIVFGRFDTSKVTNMFEMFSEDPLLGTLSTLRELDLSHFDTSKVTDMYQMFMDDTGLTAINLSSFDTSKVTDMNSMFSHVSSLETLDVSHFDTSKVTDMYEIFDNVSTLKTLDVSHFDTSKVTDMENMFIGDKSLLTLDVSHFDTSHVTNMHGMFSGDGVTSLNLSSFDTSQVTDMGGMFDTCLKLATLDLSSFTTSNTTNMSYLLSRCNVLSVIKLGSKISSLSSAALPAIKSDANYTGMWQNVGIGTNQSPLGANVWTSSELESHYKGGKQADTYVWQPVRTMGGEISVNYVDEAGQTIHAPQILNGYVAQSYDVSTPTYKLTLPGYSLDQSKLPTNATGIFQFRSQTVTYVYQKAAVKGKDVTVKYVDETGQTIHDPQTLSGNIGEPYNASTATYKLTLPNYSLDQSKLPANATGTFSDQAQTVTYVYQGILSLTVPAAIDFGSYQLGTSSSALPYSGGAVIVTNYTGQGWILTAALANGSSDFSHYLMNSSKKLNESSTLATSTSGSDKTTMVNSSWKNKTGLWIDYSSAQTARTDSEVLNWTLTPDVSKEVNE